MNDSQIQKQQLERKLRYRAWHMGTKELDLLCGGYLDHHCDEMTFLELRAFQAMLKLSDCDLQQILLTQEILKSLPDWAEPHAEMIHAIRNFFHQNKA